MQLRYSTSLRLAVAAVLLLVAAAPAAAGIPSPANCTVPIPIVACPAGDVVSRVVVRDIGNFPVGYCVVTIDLSACPGLVLCPVQRPEVTYDPATHRVSMTADGSGVADFRIRMGGTCTAGAQVSLPAYGLPLWLPIPVASPDQNADLLVSPADTVVANGLVGTQNRIADFDGNGFVTEADVAWILDVHGGQSCDNVVPTRTATWGWVKIRYR